MRPGVLARLMCVVIAAMQVAAWSPARGACPCGDGTPSLPAASPDASGCCSGSAPAPAPEHPEAPDDDGCSCPLACCVSAKVPAVHRPRSGVAVMTPESGRVAPEPAVVPASADGPDLLRPPIRR